MGPARLLLPALLLLGCAQSPPPAPPQAPLRATSGPVSRPTPISTPIDRDGDRVPDGSDQCPTQPGSLRDGCPVVDRDGDGISDKYDKCPDVPEVRDGRADGDGVRGDVGLPCDQWDDAAIQRGGTCGQGLTQKVYGTAPTTCVVSGNRWVR